MSKVDAHWKPEIFDTVLNQRNAKSPSTLIIGNGDVKTIEEAIAKTKEFNIDGVMLGVQIISNGSKALRKSNFW